MNTRGLDRAGTVCLGLILLAWAGFNLPGFWRTAAPEMIAAQIVGGRSYPLDTIDRARTDAEAETVLGACRPATTRAVAILNLYQYENAVGDGRSEDAGRLLESLRGNLRTALHCEPSDGYLWLVLFSMENKANNLTPDHLEYLRMSYRLAPHEGWVALKRNAVALAAFPALDPELVDLSRDEFAALLENGLYEEAATIFGVISATARQSLLERLSRVPIEKRKRFAEVLEGAVPGVSIPSVSLHDDHPWKH